MAKTKTKTKPQRGQPAFAASATPEFDPALYTSAHRAMSSLMEKHDLNLRATYNYALPSGVEASTHRQHIQKTPNPKGSFHPAPS